jgi:hypothetical protein
MVIDFSAENRRFALELAAAAEVTIDYAVCDVLKAADLNGACDFDVLVLELGILHYHQDLDLFFAVMRKHCFKRISSTSKKVILERRAEGLFPD